MHPCFVYIANVSAKEQFKNTKFFLPCPLADSDRSTFKKTVSQMELKPETSVFLSFSYYLHTTSLGLGKHSHGCQETNIDAALKLE